MQFFLIADVFVKSGKESPEFNAMVHVLYKTKWM